MLAPASRRTAPGLDMIRLATLLVPSLLLMGAFGSQVIGGLHPCEMCIWQRWPHGIAIALVLVAMVLGDRQDVSRKLTWAAIIAIAVSGLIGVFHAGVEQDWWEGLTTCSTGSVATFEDMMNAPLVRCDEIPWSWMGISLAGWNAVLSLGAAAVLSFLLLRETRA